MVPIVAQLELQSSAFDEFKLPIMITKGYVDGIEVKIPWWSWAFSGINVNETDEGKGLEVTVQSITAVCQPFHTLESDWDENKERKRAHEAVLKAVKESMAARMQERLTQWGVHMPTDSDIKVG